MKPKKLRARGRVHGLSLCVFYLAVTLLAGAADAAFFPDYFPLDPVSHGIKTFEWTYGNTGWFISRIGQTEAVPYGSGSITGTQILNFSDWGDCLASNDGLSVKILGYGEYYISTDTVLTSHPSVWAFGSLSDGQIIDQGSFYALARNLSYWEMVDDQMILVTIEDVSVLHGAYTDVVILWYLHTDWQFAPLLFHGQLPELQNVLPTSTDTGGYAVTAFEIYGLQTGLIAFGDIDAATGSLNDLCQLADVLTCAPVYRFWKPADGTHFYTISESEKNKLINDYSHVYTYEGPVYYAFAEGRQPAEARPVYRFWNAAGGTHFYTMQESEADKLINDYSHIYTFEGPVFYAYAEGEQPAETQPVYRFWKQQGNTHFYTIKESEKNKLINNYSHIYTHEGPVWYAYAP